MAIPRFYYCIHIQHIKFNMRGSKLTEINTAELELVMNCGIVVLARIATTGNYSAVSGSVQRNRGHVQVYHRMRNNVHAMSLIENRRQSRNVCGGADKLLAYCGVILSKDVGSI